MVEECRCLIKARMGGFEIGAGEHEDVIGAVEEPLQNNGTIPGTEEVDRPKPNPEEFKLGW